MRHSWRTVSPPTPESKTPTGLASMAGILRTPPAFNLDPRVNIVRRVMRGSLAVAAVPLLALAFAGPAAAFSREDVRVTMDDGVGIAATLYRPDGEAPVQGWPAIVMFHGLGADRGTPYQQNSIAEIAETYLAPQGYAVLTFDARGHGQSGGLCSLDGPREVQDARTLFGWLTSQPGIDAAHVGAFGISLGAGYALDAV